MRESDTKQKNKRMVKENFSSSLIITTSGQIVYYFVK